METKQFFKRGRKRRYQFDGMAVNESRAFDGNTNTIRTSACAWAKRSGNGWKFRSATVDGKALITRVA